MAALILSVLSAVVTTAYPWVINTLSPVAFGMRDELENIKLALQSGPFCLGENNLPATCYIYDKA